MRTGDRVYRLSPGDRVKLLRPYVSWQVELVIRPGRSSDFQIRVVGEVLAVAVTYSGTTSDVIVIQPKEGGSQVAYSGATVYSVRTLDELGEHTTMR